MANQAERSGVLQQLDEWLQIPMIILSLLWLLIVVVELASGTSRLLETEGTAIWIVFILKFALRLHLAPKKAAFLKVNWLTSISLILPALRMFRMIAVLRAARALRGLRLVRIVGTANRTRQTASAS